MVNTKDDPFPTSKIWPIWQAATHVVAFGSRVSTTPSAVSYLAREVTFMGLFDLENPRNTYNVSRQFETSLGWFQWFPGIEKLWTLAISDGGLRSTECAHSAFLWANSAGTQRRRTRRSPMSKSSPSDDRRGITREIPRFWLWVLQGVILSFYLSFAVLLELVSGCVCPEIS